MEDQLPYFTSNHLNSDFGHSSWFRSPHFPCHLVHKVFFSNFEAIKSQYFHEMDPATITLGFIWDPSIAVWAIFWYLEGSFGGFFLGLVAFFFFPTLLFFSISFFDAGGSLNGEVILLISYWQLFCFTWLSLVFMVFCFFRACEKNSSQYCFFWLSHLL